MKDETTPQDAKALPPASHGSVAVGVVEHARKCVDFWRNMMSATDRIVVFDAPSLAIGGVADLVDDLLAEIARLRLTNYVMLEAVGEIEQLRGSIEWHKEVLVEAEEKMVRLRLTDAEREAVERLCEATSDMIDDDKRADGCHWQDDAAAVAVVRGLLERTQNTQDQERRAVNTENKQDAAEPSLASSGSVAWALVWDSEDRIDVEFVWETKEEALGAVSAANILGKVIPLYRSPTLTDAERDAIRRLSPRGDPLASRTVTLTPTERRVFHGLLERMGGGE